MRKVFYQWAPVGILAVFGYAIDLMPGVDTWIPSAALYGLAFFWLIGAIIYWFKHRKKDLIEETDSILKSIKLKFSELYKIIPILREMHEHLWRLADGLKIVNVDMPKFSKTGNKINQIMRIKTGQLDANKSITEMIEDTKKMVAIKEKQVMSLIKKSDYQKTYDIVKKSTKILDADGYGLKNEKENNKKYLRYNEALKKYYDFNKELVDLSLKYLIDMHIGVSEYFCNGLLVLKRVDWITKKTGIPDKSEFISASTQANLEDIKRESNSRLNEIRIMISEHIKDLEKREWERLKAVNPSPTEQ